MVDMRLLLGKLKPNLNEFRHIEETLSHGIDSLFKLHDFLFGWEQSGGSDEFCCIVT